MTEEAEAQPQSEREEEVNLKLLLGNAKVLLHDAIFFYENADISECIINLDEAIGSALIARNRMGAEAHKRSTGGKSE